MSLQRQVKSQDPDLMYGETAYIQNSSYFLGQLGHGQTLQSFENNLYRTPIYSHTPFPTDFLLIVSGDKVYIRDMDALFLQGQQCPKVEVPAPNSKSSTAFQKDLLQVSRHDKDTHLPMSICLAVYIYTVFVAGFVFSGPFPSAEKGPLY